MSYDLNDLIRDLLVDPWNVSKGTEESASSELKLALQNVRATIAALDREIELLLGELDGRH